MRLVLTLLVLLAFPFAPTWVAETKSEVKSNTVVSAEHIGEIYFI